MTAPLLAALVLGASGPSPCALEEGAARVRETLERLGLEGFRIAIASPFVLVGDEGRGSLEERRDQVLWALEHLEKELLDTLPARAVTVWVFRDLESFLDNGEKVLGTRPRTPYGLYLEPRDLVLVNVDSGEGTLVHEIVHPLLRADCPGCPAWLDEGLGTLFEQCGERRGRLVGRTNWRLPALQRAIREGGAPGLDTLLAADAAELHGSRQEILYAEARYLLHYAQERDRLALLYRRVRERGPEDPSGRAALLEVLGEPSLDALERRLRDHVLGLRYPERPGARPASRRRSRPWGGPPGGS